MFTLKAITERCLNFGSEAVNMALTRLEEIEELKKKIAEMESIKYPGLLVLSVLNEYKKKLKELENLEKIEE